MHLFSIFSDLFLFVSFWCRLKIYLNWHWHFFVSVFYSNCCCFILTFLIINKINNWNDFLIYWSFYKNTIYTTFKNKFSFICNYYCATLFFVQESRQIVHLVIWDYSLNRRCLFYSLALIIDFFSKKTVRQRDTSNGSFALNFGALCWVIEHSISNGLWEYGE